MENAIGQLRSFRIQAATSDTLQDLTRRRRLVLYSNFQGVSESRDSQFGQFGNRPTGTWSRRPAKAFKWV
jgi:hypothetical protein